MSWNCRTSPSLEEGRVCRDKKLPSLGDALACVIWACWCLNLSLLQLRVGEPSFSRFRGGSWGLETVSFSGRVLFLVFECQNRVGGSILGKLQVLEFTCGDHGVGQTYWGGGDCPGFELQQVTLRVCRAFLYESSLNFRVEQIFILRASIFPEGRPSFSRFINLAKNCYSINHVTRILFHFPGLWWFVSFLSSPRINKSCNGGPLFPPRVTGKIAFSP